MRKRLLLLVMICGLLFTTTACGNDNIADENMAPPQNTEENPFMQSEDAIGDSSATEPDHDNEDAVKPQDNDKENSTTKSDTDKKVNDAIPSENNVDNSSTESNDNGQSSVTLGILDSSTTSQNGSSNLGADDEGNKNSDTQMSESKNETILSK